MQAYDASSRPRRPVTNRALRCLIDRRAFLKAGLVAAGSALGTGLIGCNSEGFSIPCLGPASAPTPIPGMTYIRASEIGCALDCDLRSGRNKYTGGAATDDAARINAAMADASAEKPITLIIDGSALVSGLFPPAGGNWSIAGLGCGTGFFVKTGTNNDGIHNGPPGASVPFDPGPPAPARGANVSLSNFTLNGNQGNGRDGNSTTGFRQGSKEAWYCGINLMNLDNINIENVVVVNTPAYHIRFSNVGNVSASGCVMRSHGFNTDGLHFDGPANDITISNCDFTVGDDSIGLNCPEGHTGNISRVTVKSCTFNSWSLMRLYTTNYNTNKFNIDSVSVSNCNGKLAEAAFLIGISGQSNPNSIDNLTIADCTLATPTILGMAENFGNISLRNVTLTPLVSPPWSNPVGAFLRPSPLYRNLNVSFFGSNLSFENCRICRSGNLSIAAVILENDSTINNITFNGFGVQDMGTAGPVAELVGIVSGAIGEIVLNSVSSSNIRSLVSANGFYNVASVSGTGVLATGWEFPDPVMADEVPYISASSGLPSIKINGVVELYTG